MITLDLGFVAMNFLLDSGIRATELLSIRAGDIDFQTRFITLQGEVNKKHKPLLYTCLSEDIMSRIYIIRE